MPDTSRTTVVAALGSKEITAALKRAGADIKKAALKEMLNTGFEIQRNAARMAPVLTGYLRANIGVYVDDTEGRVAVANGMVSGDTEIVGMRHVGGGPLDVNYAAKQHDTNARSAGYLAKAAAAAEAGHYRRMRAALASELR